MFDLINQSFIFLLESIHNIIGDYGWAIILITVAFRLLLWPVSKSQMDSMAQMQALQPKMKAIQDRYKNDPQQLQQEMMKLYKDHKFNPMSGCLPMLIQLPLFIGLYGAIMSPNFMVGQNPIFLNFVHLKRTGIISHGGTSYDGTMSLAQDGGGSFFGIGKDNLMADKDMTLTLKNGKTVLRKVPEPNKSVSFKPKEHFLVGVPVKVATDFSKLNLEGYEGNIEKIGLNVTNTATKETEAVTFTPTATGQMTAELPTTEGDSSLHFDILLLVALFGVTMFGSQKMMPSAQSGNNQQQAMMKMMPLMFTGLLVFFPIPAGVLLYMVVNGLFQMIQGAIFKKGGVGKLMEKPPSDQVVDIN
ncbi:MAG: membrane protein insertase YidC [Cyanobacteria bacterium HKST-UBA06]|nr:membrane protein insertase YidC [Cyanobacteria bacterium HKST-UBA05]MCA9798726.1 membrane protein insertase YidC [Cyanobacteria bacterium HKST-UBA04]MCA9807356.1 membrane protein insertase YidC [Cyanobacteria bacterium HKST-UBA06]MCA9840519.1 membrane protein insertase YidC [Cyanobacteria bacterium HKST-UBA03]